MKPYCDAWDEYEHAHRAPQDDGGYETWHSAGLRADKFAVGLAAFLVMSSGEVAALRLLGTLASTGSVPPFGVAHIRSLDREGQRLIDDWCAVVLAY